MQIKCGFDVATAKRVSDEHHGIKVALDNVNTSVMIANNDRDIIYANKSAINLFGNVEGEIRKFLPNFTIANLVGTNMDNFHTNPLLQAGLLSSLDKTLIARVGMGGRTFVLTANPVITGVGQHLGTIAEFREWEDRKNEVMIEGDLQNLMNALSNGDLSVTITNDYSGRLGQIRDDANTAVERLKETIIQIKEAIDNINTGDKNALGEHDLSRYVEEQATNREELASAEQVAQVTADASNITGKGVEVTGQAVLKMDEIKGSSRKIESTISVIEDIVLQIKMLAHTAAIEATRAGVQDGGIAAVAVEMRNLGQQAATACGEIKNLTNDSLKEVCDGSKLVTEAALAMEEIVNIMNALTVTLSVISGNSIAQMACITQVNRAIEGWKV
jgi:methyl-accepting chemotaxis protein